MVTDLSNQAAAGVRFACKASLIGAALQFELMDEGLSWQSRRLYLPIPPDLVRIWEESNECDHDVSAK